MARSDVEIANLALTALGTKLITSFLDESVEAQLSKLHYPTARDAALEEREWTFAVKRATLASLQALPEWGYAFAHQVPADTIRLIEVRDTFPRRFYSNETSNRLRWVREGNTILSDTGTVFARYLARVEDPNIYSPAFVKVVAARLAMDMCIPITQSRKTYENMAAAYEIAVKKAAVTDGMQGRTEIARSGRLTGIRGQHSSITGVV